MDTKENLELELQSLISERDRLLRGLGQRYSRRFKQIPYDKRFFKSPEEHQKLVKSKIITAKKSVKKTKDRLAQISDDISDVKRKLNAIDEGPIHSSQKFNKVFRESMDL